MQWSQKSHRGAKTCGTDCVNKQFAVPVSYGSHKQNQKRSWICPGVFFSSSLTAAEFPQAEAALHCHEHQIKTPTTNKLVLTTGYLFKNSF